MSSVSCTRGYFVDNACEVVPTLAAAPNDAGTSKAAKTVMDWLTASDVSQWQCNGNALLLLVAASDVKDVATILAAMLSKGADPNAAYPDGRTPLHVAVTARDPNAVTVLLAYHANPNLAAKDGSTPLLALTTTKPRNEQLERDSLAIAKSLMDAGADPNIKAANGMTAMDLASSTNNIALHDFLLSYRSSGHATSPQ